MKIAVTNLNNEIFQHFGKCQNFMIYKIENGKIVLKYEKLSGSIGHEDLAIMLKKQDVDVLICGGIGVGAQQALAQFDITFVSGVSGNIDQAVEKYLRNELAINNAVSCNCSEHEHTNTDCHCQH